MKTQETPAKRDCGMCEKPEHVLYSPHARESTMTLAAVLLPRGAHLLMDRFTQWIEFTQWIDFTQWIEFTGEKESLFLRFRPPKEKGIPLARCFFPAPVPRSPSDSLIEGTNHEMPF